MNELVSVIVCHHTGTLIDRFIESIKESIRVNYEVVVVTSDLAYKRSGVKVLYSSELPAEKRNQGAMLADGEYLAFFDDDTEVESDCLYQMLRMLDKYPDTAMVYAKCLKGDERNRLDEAGGFLTFTGFIWSRAEQNVHDYGQYDFDELIFAGKSAACMVRRSAFNQVGGFDKDFGILGEESDLSWRLWLTGYKVMFCYKAVAYHYFNTKYKPKELYYTSQRVHYNGARNYCTMLIKNMGGQYLWFVLPTHILLWTTSAIGLMCTGKIKAGLNVLRGLLHVLRTIPRSIRKRASIQGSRTVTEGQISWIIYKTPRVTYYAQRFIRYITGGLHG